MSETEIQAELKNLQKQAEDYERLLASVGVECNDLPEDVNEMLDKCTALQQATHLQDLNEIYLQQWYNTKRKEAIDHNLEMKRLEAEVRAQEHEIQTLKTEQISLKSFIADNRRRECTDAEMVAMKTSIDTREQNLLATQKLLKCPSDIDFDELIKKIDILNKK